MRRVTARLKATIGAYHEAEAELREALDTYRTNRVPFGIGGALAELASVIRRAGRVAEAIPLAFEALKVFQTDVTSTSGMVTALVEIAHCLKTTGEVSSAREHATKALSLDAEVGGGAKAHDIQQLLDSLGGSGSVEGQRDAAG